MEEKNEDKGNKNKPRNWIAMKKEKKKKERKKTSKNQLFIR